MVILAAMLYVVALGCSGSNTPTSPNSDLSTSPNKDVSSAGGHSLWGYYDLYFDFEAGTVEAVVNRTTMFNANVVDLINPNPAGLTFLINSTPVGPNYVDVDIDVGIAHPVNLAAYDGYDVMGVFIGDGSSTLTYDTGDGNTNVDYAAHGTDQTLLNADGYTAWFNPTEFTTPGLGGYTPGSLATPGYTGSATINPYKLFASDLGATDSAYDFVSTMGGPGNNVFTHGETNTRNYYLRFPLPDPGVAYNYAIVASWVDEVTHPVNTAEAVAISVTIDPDVYFVDGGNNGGDLILDLSLAGYGGVPSTIVVDSTVQSAPVNFDPSVVVTGGGATYSTYHVELSADAVLTTTGNEFFVVAEYGNNDYTSILGPNTANRNLAAYFRSDLFVSPVPYNAPPEIVSGVDGEVAPFIFGMETYTVVATDADLDPLTYSWDVYNVTTATDLLTDDPGNGDGTIDLDFAALAAANGDVIDVSCDVSDGTDTTAATTLEVTASNIIYLYDGTVDNGGMTVLANGGSGAAGSWNYNAGKQAWDESTSTPYPNNNCTILGTPALNIPAGSYTLHLEIKHWTGTEAGSTYYYDSGNIGYTTNGGSTYTMNAVAPGSTWLTYSSGTNFGTQTYNYGAFYSVPNCTWYTYPTYSYIGWAGKTFQGTNGSQGAPVTSDFTCNSLKGVNGVQYAFMWKCDTCCYGASTEGWGIRSVKIYAS
jgi:hypothetical protein